MKGSKNKEEIVQEHHQNDEDVDDEEEDEEIEMEDEEIEEEIEEDEEEEVDEDDDQKQQQFSQSPNNANSTSNSQQQSGGSTQGTSNSNQAGDKRPRLSDELFEINLKRKREHVGSALYIPFPRKVTEDEVRNFVGQGPNIFLVGPQKQNAIVRYRTQSECEKQQKDLAKKEFEGQTLNIEPKTVKVDPANIDVKTLIVQYSNPDLCIVDFASVFMKAISISLKGGKNKKESQEDLSFGSAIIIFSSHEEAKEAFLTTEDLTIKDEKLRVVFADFRTPNQSFGARSGGQGGFRNKGDSNRGGNFFRGNQGGGRQGGGNGGGGGGFRNRNRNSSSSGGGGGQRNFGNRNFNSNNSGGGMGGGNNGNYGQGRNYSPHKKFRGNVR